MRPYTAILLSTPVVLGVVALIARDGRAPVSRPAAKADIVSTEPRRATEEARGTQEAEASHEEEPERTRRPAEERERVVERLLAIYEDRIAWLIETIDWTSAESRVRFPIECDLIKAELAREWVALESDDR